MAAKKNRPHIHRRRTRSERKIMRRNFFRKLLEMLLLLLCAVPMFGGGVQPLWVIPAAVCIAVQEDMYFTMGMAAVAGLLVDIACGTVLGASAIFLVCWCTFAVLLFEQILRRSFLHYFWLNAAGTFLYAALRYCFSAALFRLEGRELFWSQVLLPSALRTLVVSLVVFVLYLPLRRLSAVRVQKITGTHRGEGIAS